MGLRHFALGCVFGISLLGCAGAAFNYRYYGLDADLYDGKLLGSDEEGKDDLPFSTCTPTAAHKSPCVVLLEGEFLKLKQDLLETRQRLKACEQGQ